MAAGWGMIFGGVLAVAGAMPCAALTLDLPAKVLAETRRTETPGGYALPIAPFDGVAVPVRQAEGDVDQRVYRLAAEGMTTLAVMAPLRAQVVAAGFSVVLDCDARACGGFDFRFGTEVVAEPDMHVDIGDFRFLSAEKAGEVISVLVSRSSVSAFVQITRVGPQVAVPVAEPVAESVAGPDVPVVEPGVDAAPRGTAEPGSIAAALEAVGSVALDDLVFASGAAALEPGDYASLKALVAWLAANPQAAITLVGHTDTSGGLAANIALSERRAELVRRALIDQYGAEGTRIAAQGVGYLAPRATNQSEEGRMRNRRVEVVVTSAP